MQLALDDFGTGVSSLTLLRSYPFAAVKVDRSFVAGLRTSPEDDAVVEAVLTLAHRLGMTPVAEGVETVAQLERLVELGCSRAQGYLLGRPEPADVWERQLLPAAERRVEPSWAVPVPRSAGGAAPARS